MKRNDPNELKSIADRILSKTNPDETDGKGLDLDMRLDAMLFELHENGINISSYNEEQWMDLLRSKGVPEEDLVDVMETVASWGVTDDDPIV